MPTTQPSKCKDRPCDACVSSPITPLPCFRYPICPRCYAERHGRCRLRERKTRCVMEEESSSSKRKVPQTESVNDNILEAENAHPRRRLSSSSTLSRKSHTSQTGASRTSHGKGVEEHADSDASTPSFLKPTLGLQINHHNHYVGPTRALEPPLRGTLPDAQVHVPSAEGILRRLNSKGAFASLPDPGFQGRAKELSDLNSIEAIVSPHGRSLVDLYFLVVSPSFPILDKAAYLETYNQSYKEISPPLLAAVYVLASNYWSHDYSLGRHNKPDFQRLEKLARTALGATIHRPKLSTVQAGLLLLQHSDTDSAELTTQLVSVAYGLGLHLDASNWEIPSSEKGLRKRLGWALFMQSYWASLGSGRPPLIHSSNWGLQSVTNSDFPENTFHEDEQGNLEVERGRTIFTHMISLSEILAELLETAFTVKASRDIAAAELKGVTIVLEKVKLVQIKLKEWFSNLPECLSMDSTNNLKHNAVGYLRLAYMATDITIHRRIILALNPPANPRLCQICRSVAHEKFISAFDFVQSLKPQHISSFWYFASPENFALVGVFGTLLLSTAPNEEEADLYRTKLREYRWILKVNSEVGAPYMKPAMALIDANMAILKTASGPALANLNAVKDGLFMSPNSFSPTNNKFVLPSEYAVRNHYHPNTQGTGSSAMYSPAPLNVSQPQNSGRGAHYKGKWAV